MKQQDNIRIYSYYYYQEAIAWREQQKMPTVGISIDRRTLKHVSIGLKSFPPTSLVCACCKCQYTCTDGINSEAGRIDAANYFSWISARSFRYNWCFAQYMNRFGSIAAMENHPDLEEDAWTFKRLLKHPAFPEQVILCCPQDIKCSQNHNVREIHGCCLLPLCYIC